MSLVETTNHMAALGIAFLAPVKTNANLGPTKGMILGMKVSQSDVRNRV